MATTPSSEIRKITPPEAMLLLESNSDNRTIRENKVAAYARDMREGNWELNGEAIILDAAGNLVNGQHRLRACIEANRAFTTFVVVGVSKKSQATMDHGVPRTIPDLLRWNGYKDTPALAAAISAAYRWQGDRFLDRSFAPTPTQAMNFIKANPGLVEAVRISSLVRGAPVRMRVAAYAPFVNRVMDVAPEEFAEFHEKLASGLGMTQGDPVYALRRWLARTFEKTGVVPTDMHMAVTVKAWNAMLLGEDVGFLVWKRSGTREDFPKLLLPSDLEG